jgi:hypothetical protein
MNTFPANAHLLLQLMNPFDASIHSTASRMVENKTSMFTTPVQFLPQLVLLIINMAVLLIWVALYPLGILLVFSTVLWRPLEAQCECFRAKFKDPQLTLLCCNAPHRSYPVSCIVLPLFFLGFLLVPGAWSKFQQQVHRNEDKVAGLLWLVNIELLLMQLGGACLEFMHPLHVLNQGYLISYTSVIL